MLITPRFLNQTRRSKDKGRGLLCISFTPNMLDSEFWPLEHVGYLPCRAIEGRGGKQAFAKTINYNRHSPPTGKDVWGRANSSVVGDNPGVMQETSARAHCCHQHSATRGTLAPCSINCPYTRDRARIWLLLRLVWPLLATPTRTD